jgi:formyltetrahydrofolate deformylase
MYGARGPDVVRLMISCRDAPGIVAGVSGFLHGRGANIITSDQWSTGNGDDAFFMRMTFACPGIDRGREEFAAAFTRDVGDRFGMDWRLSHTSERRRVTLLVSRYDHCLHDLLWRWHRGELDMDVTQVISNHDDLRSDAEHYGVTYHHVPVADGRKAEAEERILALTAGRCDVMVLARYMQILTGSFLARVGCPIINIHHSFLPAFAGAGPYERAHDRGVKLIGATAHYVTEDLDAGPIIEQDVLRVNHRYAPHDLERVGRDVERLVLARAVRSHLDDRVLVDGARTIVF